jgi:hypothetical protein
MSETGSWRAPQLRAAGILALGLIIAAGLFSAAFFAARAQRQTIKVVGSASKPFEADVAKWRLTLSRPASATGLRDAYAALRADVEHVRTTLRAAGIPDSALALQPVNAQPLWNQDGQRTGYNVQQPLYVVLGDVDRIESLALDPSRILADGAALEYSQLEYFYSRIAELKHELLADATRDAQRRATEIAQSAGSRAGRLLGARAGVFQITEPYSTEVSGFGVHSTATRSKEITVTVHGDFELR